jgi:hypothetical protein
MFTNVTRSVIRLELLSGLAIGPMISHKFRPMKQKTECEYPRLSYGGNETTTHSLLVTDGFTQMKIISVFAAQTQKLHCILPFFSWTNLLLSKFDLWTG